MGNRVCINKIVNRLINLITNRRRAESCIRLRNYRIREYLICRAEFTCHRVSHTRPVTINIPIDMTSILLFF